MDNITGKRVRQEREQKSWTQAYLAERMRFPDSSYISKIENGIRKTTPEEIIMLASLFGCTVKYLMGQTDERYSSLIQESPNEYGKHNLPILGTIRAGLPILADENIDGYLDIPEDIQADFVLEVVGDSMIGAGILDGDYVVCRESQTANSGQIVVALKDLATGFSEATLKYYYMNGNSAYLRSANPNYPDLNMSDGYRIAGITVGLVRKEPPGYSVYREYISIPGYEEWTEVIEKAAQAGIKPQHLASHVDMLIEMGRRKP